MNDLSFSEKIKVLVDVSSSSGICLATILILAFMAFMFLTTNRRNAKSSKKFYIGIYSILLLAICGCYYNSLSNMFDYMMNNFFIVFYFPNLAVYLFAIIVSNIILFSTIFNFREDKLLKYINTTVYSMINYLLVLVLNVITSNKLDVFDQSSVYKNQDASALISLTSIIFIVWVIFLIVYKLIRKKQKRRRKIRIPIREVVTYKKKMPTNFKSIDIPVSVVRQGASKEEDKKELLEQYDSMFTIDDYKKVLEILKCNTNHPTSNDSVQTDLKEGINIDEQDSQPYIINTRVIASDEYLKSVEQPKIEELLNLYKSI